MSPSHHVDMLILGAGWTAKFLEPQLQARKIEYAATTTTGHDNTIPFKFDPSSDDEEPYKALPAATTVLITFPLKGEGQSKRLIQLYNATHSGVETRFIQLGSTGIFQNDGWNSHTSPYDKTNARAVAEDELLATAPATVLNLAGLYDDQIRRPRNWVPRIAKSKADVKAKKSLHLIHGADVSRAIIACHESFDAVQGKRWIIADLFTYDWWSLLMGWGGTLEDSSNIRQAVGELMLESGIRALPRGPEKLGRVLDARDFWRAVDTWPQEGSVS